MKFGKKYAEASAPASSGNTGRWIKNFKEGETKIRFLQEIKDWVVYYEHYNPAGSYFPCTGDRDTCPGCTSTNERMKSASRKVAVNALVGEYQDVYKLSVRLVQRLEARAERNGGTITDRDYIVTRIGMDQNTEYDLESGAAVPIDLKSYTMMDIEAMLAQQFSENFPDFEDEQVAQAQVKAPKEEPRPAPFDQAPPAANTEQEVEITLDQLHSMTPDQLRDLVSKSGVQVPAELDTQQAIIAWMEQQFA